MLERREPKAHKTKGEDGAAHSLRKATPPSPLSALSIILSEQQGIGRWLGIKELDHLIEDVGFSNDPNDLMRVIDNG